VQRKVTIDDIARHSGASRTTVSLVLRNKPGIGTETRERVWLSAQQLGYQRKPLASIETGQNVLNIGLILRSRNRNKLARLPGVNAFYSWVLAGVEAAARQHKMNLLYTTLPVDDDNVPLEFPSHILSQELDGVLLVGSFSEAVIAEVASTGPLAIVLVDAAAGSHRYDAVISDNLSGAYAAVSHLIANGHERIAFVSPAPEADPNFRLRREGYLKALKERGLEPYFARMTQDDAATPTLDVLRKYPDLTAIFGCNDVFAIAAMQAAQTIGRKVPEDLSVVGFDDIEIAAQMTPPLTTMAVDKITMGRLAVQSLAYRLAWPEAAKIQTVVQPDLIVRGSVARLSPATQS
jgi:DNA-binding LacI/PurR family transcriptional regulator